MWLPVADRLVFCTRNTFYGTWCLSHFRAIPLAFTMWITWRHRSRDHCTGNMWFPVYGQFEPTVYLARLPRYGTSVIRSLRCPIDVTRRHRSRDLWTHNTRFPVGDLLKPTPDILHDCWNTFFQSFSVRIPTGSTLILFCVLLLKHSVECFLEAGNSLALTVSQPGNKTQSIWQSCTLSNALWGRDMAN